MRRYLPQVLCLVVLVLLTTVVAPSSALGYHDDETKVTEDTAYTLRDGELRLGLWKLEYGLLDDLDLGTWITPWVFRFASLYTKYEVWHDDAWSVAAGLGIYRLNLANVGELAEGNDAKLTVVPFQLVGTYRFVDDWSVSLGANFTKIAVDGSSEEAELEGAAAVTNLQMASNLEWRIGDVTALYLHSRYLAYQDTSAASTFTFEPDNYTTVEVVGAASSDVLDVRHAWSAVLGAVFSWESFNLRVGAGYGNMNLPFFNFVLPTKIPFPELAMYWRW